ncbi:hypothetical protein D8M36_03010 [Dermabacter sp. HSID17554]|nr:hypothetical protein D8M36_03010 [Dermabacter sp. HSID17554]
MLIEHGEQNSFAAVTRTYDTNCDAAVSELRRQRRVAVHANSRGSATLATIAGNCRVEGGSFQQGAFPIIDNMLSAWRTPKHWGEDWFVVVEDVLALRVRVFNALKVSRCGLP